MEYFFILIIVGVAVVILNRQMSNKIDDLRDDIGNDIERLRSLIKEQAQKQEEVKSIEKVVSPSVEPIIKAEPKVVEIVEELSPLPVIEVISEVEAISLPPPIPMQRETIESPIAAVVSPEIEKPSVEQYNTPPIEPEEKNDFERFLSENLLSKIGIVTLVLGIAYFVKYAIDQNWINEIGRVGIGVLTGAGIIAVAHKLKEKYHAFSSILVGGGISVLYITITLAFQEYGLLSQSVAFGLLIAITVFSVILSLLYDRKELAIFSLLGGFGSPLMISSGTGNYIVLFSYIFILNAGMLVVAFRKEWRIVSMTAYGLTQIFLWAWLLNSFKTELQGATIFVSLFFIQFYVLALIDHFKQGKGLTPYQAIIILTNNLSLFGALMFIYDGYPQVRGFITVLVALVNAIPMVLLFRKQGIDKNIIYLLIGVVMTFVSLAIPIQLNGCAITMFWAAEAVILLWLWQKSGIQLFRIGYMLIQSLTVIAYLMDINNVYYHEANLPIVMNQVFMTGVVLIASFILTGFLLKKDATDVEFYGFEFSLESLRKVTRFVTVLLIFIVPYLELDFQLGHLTFMHRHMLLGAYIYSFLAIFALIRWKMVGYSKSLFALLTVSCFAYLLYQFTILDVRDDIVFSGESWSPFYLHFIYLLALPVIITYLWKMAKGGKLMYYQWGLSFFLTMILSVEADNIATMIFANLENYDSVLSNTHKVIYPILWGVIALVYMIWGLKVKSAVIRRISLALFGLIILKLYLYDVWTMPKAGVILSFIALGVILLVASFIFQKIKILVQDDDAEKDKAEIDSDSTLN